jgi:hypothetical protein
LVRLFAQRFIMLRTLTHPSGQHNALTVNWEATVGEQVSRGSRRLKRPQTEPFHDTAARILPAERDDTRLRRLASSGFASRVKHELDTRVHLFLFDKFPPIGLRDGFPYGGAKTDALLCYGT